MSSRISGTRIPRVVDSERKLGEEKYFKLILQSCFLCSALFLQLHSYLSMVACEEEISAILEAPTSEPMLTSALEYD